MLVVDLDRLDDPAAPVRVPVSPGVLAADRVALAREVAAATEHLRTVDVLAAEMARRRTITLARLRAARATEVEQARRERARDDVAALAARVRRHDERANEGRPPRPALLPVGVRRSPPRVPRRDGRAGEPRRTYDPDPVATPEQARARWVACLAAQRRRDAAAQRRREREAGR